MVDVVEVFQLPGDMKGDVYGPGTDGEGRGNIALEGVADHQQFRGVYLLVLTEGEKFALGLVGSDLNVVEVLQQTATLQLIFLILQFTLGEDHHLHAFILFSFLSFS